MMTVAAPAITLPATAVRAAQPGERSRAALEDVMHTTLVD
jgi:hypothetical protein